jgi:glycosyltransferase involved in cell wall biosynthesis
VVGTGPDNQLLKSLAIRLGVAQRVEFCGRVAQDQMSSRYSAADILVLPSLREGTPNVVLEAMACGTPVVATDVGGISELVTGAAAGRLMADRTVAGLVREIRALWAQRPDREAVRRHASQFGWSDAIRGQLELFSRLTAANAAGRAQQPAAGGGTASGAQP